MATSRTGTAKYLRNRARVLTQAARDGLTHCPGYDDYHCGVELDYSQPGLPNSVEADHVKPVALGGNDDVENLRVLCRACNNRRNRKSATIEVARIDEFPLLYAW